MKRSHVTTGLMLLALTALGASSVAAQSADTRYGVWRIESTNPPPSLNIMTYEPAGDGGMQVTVEATNARGETTRWGYTTMFDGVFRPVHGQENSETAVEFVDEFSTRITNKRNGRVTQVIINTLTPDLNMINNEYVRFNEEGQITAVTHATYHRIR